MTFWSIFGVLAASAGLAAHLSTVLPGQPPPSVELRGVPNGGIQPEVLLDSTGVLHMLYFAGESASGDLFYVRSRDLGASFSRPVRVNSQPGSAIATGTIRGGQLAPGRDGRVHIVWNGSHKALPPGPAHPKTGRPGMPLLYSRSTEGGSAFEPQRNLLRRTWALDGGASVAADAAGRVFVTWHAQSSADAEGDESTRRLWIAQSADDGTTFEEERVAWDRNVGTCACCGVRAFSASSGTLFVLFRSATEMVNRDMHLLTSRDAALTFTARLVHPWNIPACPMTSMSFVESRGRVFGAWETTRDVYLGALDAAAPAPPVAPTAPASTGRKHPRLAAVDNELLLVWTEGSAWARGGSVGWQRFDADGRPIGEPQTKPGVPTWSFASVVAHPGGFVIFH